MMHQRSPFRGTFSPITSMLMLALLASHPTYAMEFMPNQQHKQNSTQQNLTGTVYSDGSPIDGVTITVKEKPSINAVTNNRGAFSIAATIGQTLVFTRIGYHTVEKKIESNTIDNTVYQNINLVRERAGLPKVDELKYNNQAKLRELVRREFRSEFTGEGRRRFDILRWGIAKEVMNGPVVGSLSNGTVNLSTGEVTFTSTTERFSIENRIFIAGKNELWPIPQSAIDASKGTLKPNPGY